jgi:hypothetical protein
MKTIFSKNGVTIIFVPVPLIEGRPQMYTFKVEGNEDLTKKLLGAVKRKHVTEFSFTDCSEALFQMIEKGEFEELISNSEIDELLFKFQTKFGEWPKFVCKNLSSGKHQPLFEVWMINACIPDMGKQQGRTKQQAKGKVLRNFFELIPA